MPFSNRFPSASGFDRTTYVVTLLLTGASAGLLIAPSSYHRLLFRRNDKRYLVFTANQLTMWACLRRMGLPVVGPGRWLREVTPPADITPPTDFRPPPDLGLSTISPPPEVL